jgi:hypothetical protein
MGVTAIIGPWVPCRMPGAFMTLPNISGEIFLLIGMVLGLLICTAITILDKRNPVDKSLLVIPDKK